MKMVVIPPHADLLITLHNYVPTEELERLRKEFRKLFPDRRAIIVRAEDATITPLIRQRRPPYRPSMLAHGGHTC